jgi:hypothetical protein
MEMSWGQFAAKALTRGALRNKLLIFMNFSHFTPKLQIFSPFLDNLTELKTLALLVAILFFLVSFLVNLLQRRYSKTRLDRMLTKEASVLNFLVGINKNLVDLEWNCSIELQGATSPQEVGKAIHGARNKIEATITDIEKHLHSFRQYRRKVKAREKQKKGLEKSSQRTPKR